LPTGAAIQYLPQEPDLSRFSITWLPGVAAKLIPATSSPTLMAMPPPSNSPSRVVSFRRLIAKCRFARDSPLEQAGFEPLVPLRNRCRPRGLYDRGYMPHASERPHSRGGTTSSNPACSSGESGANPTSSAMQASSGLPVSPTRRNCRSRFSSVG
jgi:hypothetical protein